jgi:hypothetical protein
VTGLIVGAAFNDETSLSGVLAMVMARVKHIGIRYAMFMYPFTTNMVKTTQIHSMRCEDIARIDPTQRNSDPPCT